MIIDHLQIIIIKNNNYMCYYEMFNCMLSITMVTIAIVKHKGEQNHVNEGHLYKGHDLRNHNLRNLNLWEHNLRSHNKEFQCSYGFLINAINIFDD